MSKRRQPQTVAEATATYDLIEVVWREADEWSRALEGAFRAVLDQHTEAGRRLSAAIEQVRNGKQPSEDMAALWEAEANLRRQLEGVMACRRAAAKRRHQVYELLDKADKACERAWNRENAKAGKWRRVA